MLKRFLETALKEWAVVQRSLLEQHQLILVRKGGISEESGDFDLRAEQFLIFPTYQHESERQGDVQPCFRQWLKEEDNTRPTNDLLRLECACEVQDVVRVDDRERLIKLMPQHIWSSQFIDGRYDWEPYRPVSVILVRAYRLAEPVLVPNSGSYGGCRSWVVLDSPVSTVGATPAISSHDSFVRRSSLTKGILDGR